MIHAIHTVRAGARLAVPFLVATVAPVALAGVLASACGSGSHNGSASARDAGADATNFGADTGTPLEPAAPAPIADADRRDSSSSPVVFDRLRGGVWTANGDVGTISYANIDTHKVVYETHVGQDVTSVALSPDLKWIAAVDRRGATVALVDADSAQVRRTIAVGTHPRAAVWDAADPRWLYVSLEDDDAVAVVDRTLGVVHHEVPVGRIPSGLAVSRLRRELAVTHRIDQTVTLVPLDGVYAPADQGALTTDVGLADTPPQSDDTQPSGKPFGFESLAWAPDGNVAWLPHELLANHHPFQFQRNLFPAVSVVDLSARAEVQTNPNDPNGVVAGRKLLFGAINIHDAVGNTSVMSQPCAAAIHPNGIVAYVVACASEDLLTFDLTSGAAIDLLRGLPGDHPVGITLDDTGQRAFVVTDQSHSLVTLDLAAGSPLGHARVIAGPLALAATDPVDPEMRAGLTLFFSANSTKNPLATTGNNWMSCGGCHLDGFVSTNARFFEALSALDPTQDAQIGHVGLKDMFSTAPTPTDPSFDPHDVLVALLDQGGLAPDRTGAHRDGQVDPSAPTAQATQMATRIARVIARDLPLGPAWMLSPSGMPDPTYDADWCGQCHMPEYQAWQQSAHAHSAKDTMVKFGMGVEQQLRGTQYSHQCAGCHDPVSLRLGDSSLTSGRGITCRACHEVDRLIRAGGNSDMETAAYDWTQAHVQRAGAQLSYLKTPDFCAVCHQQFVPGTGIVAIDTLGEWKNSPFAGAAGGGVPLAGGSDAGPALGFGGLDGSPLLQNAAGGQTCVDCHMPDNGTGLHDHSVPGGNVYMAQQFGEQSFATALGGRLSAAIQLSAYYKNDLAHVTVMNLGAGHAFPTGVTDIREPWVELQAIDSSKNVIAHYGGPDSTGLLPPDAARLGMDIAQADGTVLYRHELTSATRIPFARVVPAQGSVVVEIPLPTQLPGAFVEIDAVLYYRNVRTQYYRAASGDTMGHAPDVEVARTILYGL